MKRLTINRIASAGLRANRKSYLALAAGIFLSIFLVTALCLCVDGLLARREVRVAESVGYADVVLYDKPATHDQLMQTGYFSRMTELLSPAWCRIQLSPLAMTALKEQRC